MKIGIDCRCLTRRPTGVSKLLADFIIAMRDYLPEWELYLMAPSEFHEAVLMLEGSNVKKVVCPLPTLNKHLVWYNIEFIRQCIKYKVDVMWTPSPSRTMFCPNGIKQMVSVNDVVAKEFRTTLSFHNKLIGQSSFDSSIMKADLIISISDYTKRKVEEYFPKRKQCDILVACSCSELFRYEKVPEMEIREIKAKYEIKDKFLLFVGTLEPRKNLVFLLDVMQKLHDEMPDLRLLVVGGRGWKSSSLSEKYNSPSFPREAVIFADYVDIQQLRKLYTITDCFVSAALNEGFGLPQLEAMRCGAPVVTAHNSAMIEVVEGRGITVEGYEIKDWIQAIKQALALDRQALKYDLEEYEWKSITKRLKEYVESHMK